MYQNKRIYLLLTLRMKELIKGGIVSAADEIGKLTSHQSQFVKVWYMSVAFRIMIIYSVGQEIYSKEESSFECATKQFLCQTVCYDQYMPINLIRFWIWQTHFLALVVLLFNWLQVPEKTCLTETITPHRKRKIERKKICISFIQSLILIGLEIGFSVMFLFLLAKQHSPSVPFSQLFRKGDLFFSPSVYTCDIEKSFSEEERVMYFTRKNVAFRKTPAGLRVKAQLACEQTDALCTIDRSSEKSLIVLCLSLFTCLGVLSLFFDLISCITQFFISYKRHNSEGYSRNK